MIIFNIYADPNIFDFGSITLEEIFGRFKTGIEKINTIQLF